MRAEQGNLGGELRLRPARRQVARDLSGRPSPRIGWLVHPTALSLGGAGGAGESRPCVQHWRQVCAHHARRGQGAGPSPRESCTTYSPVVRRATGTLDMLRGASHRPDTWQVPVFYSEKVALSDAKGGTRYPFFFRKEDLDQARDACAVGRVPLLLMDAVQCLTQSYSTRRTPRL